MLKRKREKVFGAGRAIPMDRNAKARVMAFAAAYTAAHRQPGQHRGPITRAHLDVLRALLWGFHNAHTGRCFPSYERIAEAAKVARSTVAVAITALEEAGVLTIQNRLIRGWQIVDGLFGPIEVAVPRRTSNAYSCHDPQAKSENRPGTPTKVLLSSTPALAAGGQSGSRGASQVAQTGTNPEPRRASPLEAALASLGAAMEAPQPS
jgi:hypothetical protein